MTLFICKQKYDYSEFGRMLEGHEIPVNAAGYFNYDVVNAYAVIIPPPGSEYSLNALVAQQVASLYIASLGRVPKWFFAGVGASVGLRQDSRDPRLKSWENSISEAVGSTKPGAFLNGGTSEENNILSFGFARAAMRLRRNLRATDELLAFAKASRSTWFSSTSTYNRPRRSRRGLGKGRNERSLPANSHDSVTFYGKPDAKAKDKREKDSGPLTDPRIPRDPPASNLRADFSRDKTPATIAPSPNSKRGSFT